MKPLMYKTVNGNSTKTDNLNDADRIFLTDEQLDNAKISKNDKGEFNADDAKLLQLKTRLNFQGNIVSAKNGSGIVIHKNAPTQQVDDFNIDAFLAKPVS